MRMRIEAQGPEIGEVGVGEGGKFWGRHELAVAANGDTLGGAALEFGGVGLAPVTRVLGERERGNYESDAKQENKNGSASHQAAISLGNDFPSGELDVWGSLDDKYARAWGIRIRLSHESDELQDCEEKVTQRLRNDRECHALFLIVGLLQGFD